VTKSEYTPTAKDTDASHPKDTPTALDIMNRHVQTIELDTSLADVVAFLIKHELSNVPVVRNENSQRILLGFVSEEDCLEFLANELFYGNPSPPQTAETIMTKHPVCVGPDEDIFTLTSIFTSHHYRHLPVVEGQHLLGIVSRRDIINALDQYYRDWTQTRDRERFPVDLHKIMNHRFLVTK
jgi:CBS-domain-containing membrane protein